MSSERESLLADVEAFRYQAMDCQQQIQNDAFSLSGRLTRKMTDWEERMDADEGSPGMGVDLGSTRKLQNRLAAVAGILSDLQTALHDL